MSQIFSNTQVDLQLIPKLDTLEFNPVSKSYLKLLVLQRIVFLLVLLIAALIVNLFVFELEPRILASILLGAVFTISLLNLTIIILGFKKRKYAIREKDIIYKQGLLVEQTTIVSFKRIQHIELQQSFIGKKLDIATLNLFTAGESGGDLKIRGLQTVTAEKINEFLSAKINEFD